MAAGDTVTGSHPGQLTPKVATEARSAGLDDATAKHITDAARQAGQRSSTRSDGGPQRDVFDL
jgi:hypothetical protein